MPHIVSFAFPACKELSVDDMVTTHAIRPASAWATPAKFWFRFSDDFVATYFRLANEVSKAGVSFVADYWSFREFIGRGWINLQMVPCGADDFVQVRKRPVVYHYEWYAAGWGFFLVRHKGAPVERGCSVGALCRVLSLICR